MNKKQTQFMDALMERKIVALANTNGYSNTPSEGKSAHRKEIELEIGFAGESDYIYISRSVGLSIGELQVVISPRLFSRKGSDLASLEGVRPAENRKSKQQVLHSSNYRGFQNKGVNGKGEHWGFGYRILANDGLTALANFLRHAKSQ